VEWEVECHNQIQTKFQQINQQKLQFQKKLQQKLQLNNQLQINQQKVLQIKVVTVLQQVVECKSKALTSTAGYQARFFAKELRGALAPLNFTLLTKDFLI
jgi:hypothetical protein